MTEAKPEIVRVLVFKPSGKFYIDEDVSFPTSAQPWDFAGIVKAHFQTRCSGMTVVAVDPPWGFPSLCVLP